jgi:hypothetical protein
MSKSDPSPKQSNEELRRLIQSQLSKAYYNGLDKKGWSLTEEKDATDAILAALPHTPPAGDEGLEWHDIPDFPNYQITEAGDLRSVFRGKVQIIHPFENPSGYYAANLYKDGKAYNRRIHRLVLQTFVGPAPEGMSACHSDGNKLNNHLSNLRWDDQRANYSDARRHGTAPIGERHGSVKLNEVKVAKIREELKKGTAKHRLAREFGVSPRLIRNIANWEIWKGVGSPEVTP